MAEREGPIVKLEVSCFDCAHLLSECEHDEQGDRSWCHSCGHPDMPAEHAYIGYTHRTPGECPLRDAAIEAAMRPRGLISVESLLAELPTVADIETVEEREQAATKGPWIGDYHPGGACGAKGYREQIIAPNAAYKVVVSRPNAALNGAGKDARQQEVNDAKFIGMAREDIPWFIGRIKALRRVICGAD